MDAPGPLTRSVEDAALLLSIIAGSDGRDRWAQAAPGDLRADLERGAGGLSIGVVTQLVDSPDTDPEIRAAVRAAAETLRGLGARVADVYLPLLPLAGAVFMALADGEAAAWHHRTLVTRGAEYDAGTRRRLVTAALLPATLAQQAARARAASARRSRTRSAASTCSWRRPAPPRRRPSPARRRRSRAGGGWPPLLQPALLHHAGAPGRRARTSLPCGFTEGGLPIGLQLIGRRLDEVTLLRAARAYERATDWRARRPPLPE